MAVFLLQEAKASPWEIALVTPTAPTPDPDAPATDPATPPEPPATGTSIGFAGYSVNPRAQTADLSIVAHHVPVIVDWVDGSAAEATFRWPSADADWVGTTAFRWLAFPAPPGHPDTPDGYETQHDVNVSGVRYRVLISETALPIVAQLMTLTWTDVGE